MNETDADDAPKTEKVISLRNLFSDAVVYGMANIFDRAVGFLLLPIVTKLLTREEYGMLNMFGVSSYIALLFFSMSMPSAFFRFYTESEDAEERRKLFSNTFWFTLTSTVLFSIPVLLCWRQLSNLIIEEPSLILVIIFVYVGYIRVLDLLGCNRLQADGRPWVYLTANIVHTIVGRGSGLYLMVQGHGFWGWLAGECIGMAAMMTVHVVKTFRGISFKIEREYVQKIVPYGASLVPAALSYWIMISTDVYLLRFLIANPLAQIGMYSVGQRISSVMQLINIAFITSWNRFAFHNMHRDDGPQLLAMGFRAYFIAGGYVALGLTMLGDDLTHWVIPSEYEAGIVVIPPLTLSVLFAGFAQLSEIGLHKMKQTLVISRLTFLTALLNVALNYMLIPPFGILGAACATMVCQFIKMIMVFDNAQRRFRIPVELGRMAVIAAIFIGCFLVGLMVSPTSNIAETYFPKNEWLFSTIAQSLLVSIMPFLFLIPGLLKPNERDFLYEMIGRLWGIASKLRRKRD